MEKRLNLAAACFLLCLVGCHRVEKPVDMPASEVGQLEVYSVTIFQARFQTANRNQGYTLGVRFHNPTRYEVASISGDLVQRDEQGQETGRTPVVFNKFDNDTIVYKGSLMPNWTAWGQFVLKIQPPPRYSFEIKSATYYEKGDDLTDIGHRYAAIARGDNAAIEKLVKEDGAALMAKDPESQTMLIHVAAAMNDLDLTKFLLDNGADFNNRARSAGTPVLMALNSGANDTASYLIDREAKLDNTIHQPTALEIAAGTCSGEVIKKLIDKGQNPNDLPARRANPLEIAAEFGNADAAQVLIDHGAPINYSDRAHTPPLFHAIQGNNVEMAEWLIGKGANVNQVSEDTHWTPLMMAAGRSNGEMIKMLLSKGASLDARDSQGKTALDYARQAGNEDAAQALESAQKK